MKKRIGLFCYYCGNISHVSHYLTTGDVTNITKFTVECTYWMPVMGYFQQIFKKKKKNDFHQYETSCLSCPEKHVYFDDTYNMYRYLCTDVLRKRQLYLTPALGHSQIF